MIIILVGSISYFIHANNVLNLLIVLSLAVIVTLIVFYYNALYSTCVNILIELKY